MGESIIEKIWSSVSYRNLLLFGIVPSLPIMLITLIFNMPIQITSKLLVDFFIAFAVYSSLSVVTILFGMGLIVSTLVCANLIRNTINENRTQHVTNTILTNDFLVFSITKKIQLRLQEMNKPLFSLQIQELEEKHIRENKEKNMMISKLEKKNKEQGKIISKLRRNGNTNEKRISQLENDFKNFLERETHSINNQENTDDMYKDNKDEFLD